MARARLELAAGDRPAAEAAVRKAAEINPKDSVVQLALAQAALTRNDLPTARTALQAAVAASPKNAAVSNAAGLLLMNAQKYDEALARSVRLQTLTTSLPVTGSTQRSRSSHLDQSGPARESLDRALAIQPGWVDAESVKVLLDLRSSGTAVAFSGARALRRKNPREAAPRFLKVTFR